jgi:hypothetical protein
MAGNATGAAAASRAPASTWSASGGPATRSAMDVIWHRLAMNFTRLPDTKDSIGTRVASKIPRKRPRGCALGRNFVETAMGIARA